MTPEEVTYLAVLICSVPIGFAFAGRGPRARQFGGAAVGVGVALATCGPHVLHSLVTALGTWGLLRALPRHCGGAALLWTFGYLLFFRTLGVWGLPEPPPYANALQLLLTLKMVSLASDVQELREAGPKAGLSEEGEELIGRLQRCPGLVEILCYSYCYLGLLTGPFYRFGTHRDWVRGPLPPPCWRRVLGRLRWAPLQGALGEALGRLFPAEGVRDPRFGQRPLPARLFYMAPVFLAFRLRFYVGWGGAEAACLAAAFGGYPPGSRPRPGQGPARPCPRSEACPGAEPWDFETIRTIDAGGTERCRRVREGLRTWNMTVQWWLAQYVHRQTPARWPRPLRSGWTMLVSAFWHGLHPGYYLSFLSVPLWLAAEAAAEGALRGRLGPRGERLVAAGHWFLKMRVFEYLCMGFVLRDAAATLAYWGSVYFCLHLLPLLILLLAAIAGPGPAAAGDKAEGEGESSRTPPDPLVKEAGEAPEVMVRKRREGPTPGEHSGREGKPTPPPQYWRAGGTPRDPHVRRRREPGSTPPPPTPGIAMGKWEHPHPEGPPWEEPERLRDVGGGGMSPCRPKKKILRPIKLLNNPLAALGGFWGPPPRGHTWGPGGAWVVFEGRGHHWDRAGGSPK